MTIATITCFYRNETKSMQIIRLNEAAEFYLERLVLPGQGVIFEAPAMASLQIHSNAMACAILTDTIPCQQLQYEAAEVVAFPVGRSPVAA